MNRTKIKNYAPQARQDFIQAVTDRAAFYGLTAKKTEPVVEKGDSVLIGGKAFPRAVGEKRKRLTDRIGQYGFTQTVEMLAYTWFNRFVAIRFMELHGYLDHGYRVLSHPEGKPTPEILDHAEHVDLPGLDKQKVIDLKIDGTKEAELYRLLLTAQCNALHSAMPFLFERIDDETELVLPDSLLHSDSPIRKLVSEIDEEDWQEVEILGWLYEAYVSERYEAVIGKVVAGEDIPAATQRFTPKWIVRYLVQNTLGRMWLATYPASSLRQQMKYYIEPAEQTPEVQEQLKAITPTSLNPEEITFLDPACGSAHILVEAYDLFKLIYQERGYRAKDIPTLILRKNLFGLEIDDRAAQLAAFALIMKARADDRSLFRAENKVEPHVLALQETKGMNAKDMMAHLNEPVLTQPLPPSDRLFEDESELFSKKNMSKEGDLAQVDITYLIDLFEDAKTFGSLIQIPPSLAAKLPVIEERVRLVAKHGEGFTRVYAAKFLPLVEQAKLLAGKFDCVVANPPYMGSKYYPSTLKTFVTNEYKEAKADLCVAFIERGLHFVRPPGFVGEITMQSWMFLSSFEDIRTNLVKDRCIRTMAHLGPHAFPNIGGQVVQVTAFVISPNAMLHYRGSYKRLIDGQSHEKEECFGTTKTYNLDNSDFSKIPGSPVAYWASKTFFEAFSHGVTLGKLFPVRKGMDTAENGRFLRLWYEIPFDMIGLGYGDSESANQSGKKWFPYKKGGSFRRWYGNNEYTVNWHRDGAEIISVGRGTIRSKEYFFRESLTWSATSDAPFALRHCDKGSISDAKGSACYPSTVMHNVILSFLNTPVVDQVLKFLNPTLEFQAGNVADIPLLPQLRNPSHLHDVATKHAIEATAISRYDWDSFEKSWDFQTLPVLRHMAPTLQKSQEITDTEYQSRFARMKELEEENNRLFIDAYGLQDELSPEVPDDQITLYRPDRPEDIKRLLSYAIGCMMGRYSLDKPGLIYAHAGNVDFDPGQYKTFSADPDGILPLTELDWGFSDDTARRIEEFIAVAWPKEHLAENLKFVEESLGQPIRKYLATGFFKDHLRWYKRRPIYWLFSSGKQRAFQCLVYLHRYHEGTLARMRTEYVIPLQSRLASRIEQLEGDKAKATSTSHRKKLQKEQDDLKKQQAELLAFDEKLKHAADMKIKLDLDDGVKINYAKFGDLVAEAKAVTGGKDDE